MRAVCAAACALVLHGCAGPTHMLPGDPGYERWVPAKPEEIASARAALAECNLRQARDLDDGRSDANVIGGAVVTACGRQSDALLDLLAKAKSTHEIELLARRWRTDLREAATVTVLKVRSGKS